LSIKTITGSGGVKAIWTVNAKKASEFVESYEPKCDILLAQLQMGRLRWALSHSIRSSTRSF